MLARDAARIRKAREKGATPTAKPAFLGLGLMGTPMATRLNEAGHDLTVCNRTSDKTRSLAVRGASVAATPAQAVAGVDAAITMVANPQAPQRQALCEALIEALHVGANSVATPVLRVPDTPAAAPSPATGTDAPAVASAA